MKRAKKCTVQRKFSGRDWTVPVHLNGLNMWNATQWTNVNDEMYRRKMSTKRMSAQTQQSQRDRATCCVN